MPSVVLRLSLLVFPNLAILFSFAGCTKFQLLDATIPTSGYRRSADLAYGDLPRQKLDVYQPSGMRPGADVVVFFYGGDWQNGSKEEYRFVAQALVSRGFVVVMPDYRLYPQVTFPAFVEDAAKAVRWAHENAERFGGNSQRLFLMGHSAGAHIVALLTLDAHYLRDAGLDRNIIHATVGLSGPYDFVPYAEDLAVFSMHSVNETPDPQMEPIHFVDGHAPPMLIVQGLKDETVKPENAYALEKAIREAGGHVELITYPDRAHVGVVLSFAWPFRWLAPTLHDVTAYFKRN